MEREEREEMSPALAPALVLPDGFSAEDLYQEAYTRELREVAAVIVTQNRELVRRIGCADFDPAVELDYSRNQAYGNIHDVFEALARYEEGRIPGDVLCEMVETTQELLDRLAAQPRAPVEEIDAARVCFQKSASLWARIHPHPRCPRKVYLRRLFGYEREGIDKALEALHAAYVRQGLAARRKTRVRRKRAVELTQGEKQRQADRKRVLRAIDDLMTRRGLSVNAAIRRLRQNGSYDYRLGSLQDETWRRYYTQWKGQ